MRAIGRRRRARSATVAAVLAVWAAGATGTARADEHDEILNLLASMTAALSADNAPEFMKVFDHKLPQYDDLSRQIHSLILEFQISSSIEILTDEGSATKRSLQLDWYMELTSREVTGPTYRRRKIIQCDMELEGKHWRIVSIKPMSFFMDRDQ